jgi:uncharacterized protein
MPEYLAPGVYVEETSFRSKSIEGVSTTTTAFVGPTRYGPVEDEPEILTSLLDFERTYGDGRPLQFADEDAAPANAAAVPALQRSSLPNYMWHAVRGFFENGGARLYVKRVFRDVGIGAAPSPGAADDRPDRSDGRASSTIAAGSPGGDSIAIKARFPGAAGGRRVRLTLQRSLSILTPSGGVSGLQDRDVVLIERLGSPASADYTFALAHREEAPDGSVAWEFSNATTNLIPPTSGNRFVLGDLDPVLNGVSVVSVSLTDYPPDGSPSTTWPSLALDEQHVRAEVRDSIFARFEPEPTRRADRLGLPVIVQATGIANGVEAIETILGYGNSVRGASPGQLMDDDLASTVSTDEARSIDVRLEGGHDGRRPTAAEYEGAPDPNVPYKLGLRAFEDLEDVSIVAAPGSTKDLEGIYADDAATIMGLLISHCERMRYRIAVLDSGDGQRISQVRALRARIDSKHAALYYPWVMVLDPISQDELALPPSGFVAGIYARNDRLRAVYKAPANETVALALRFETMLNRAQQEVLNPEGVNCFRFFEGRGNRLWGARTISSDPEWKYVNLRRYFAYLERSIDVGTQWAVFEPNGELLWANVRRTISDFLLNEFQMGALLGDKPEKAFFVKCDRSTMTQNDLDNGRLVCLIGVAPLRPAEFVIFRIGQWTADRKV